MTHATASQPESNDRSWVRIVAVLWVAEFVAMVGMSLVMPFLPLYIRELGVADREARLWAGWVGGANFFCSALVAPLWGTLADRVGRKPMAIRALIGLAVTVGLMAYVQNVYQLFGLRLLQGAFGGFIAAAIALAGVSVPRERLGSVLGVLQTAVVGGNLIGPLIGGELSQRYGYRSTFSITAGALLVAAVLVVFLVRERHVALDEAERRGVAANVRELLQLPAMRWILVCVICGHSGQMLVNPQISLFVSDLIHDPAHLNRWVGFVVAAPAVSSFAAATVWGRAGDRSGHARVLAWALVGAACCTLPAALVSALWQLMLLRFLLGSFSAAMNPSTHSVVAHSVPEHRTAGAFSLLSSAQMFGACLGPFASGPIAERLGVRPLFPVTAALMLLAAFAAYRAASAGKKSGLQPEIECH